MTGLHNFVPAKESALSPPKTFDLYCLIFRRVFACQSLRLRGVLEKTTGLFPFHPGTCLQMTSHGWNDMSLPWHHCPFCFHCNQSPIFPLNVWLFSLCDPWVLLLSQQSRSKLWSFEFSSSDHYVVSLMPSTLTAWLSICSEESFGHAKPT